MMLINFCVTYSDVFFDVWSERQVSFNKEKECIYTLYF